MFSLSSTDGVKIAVYDWNPAGERTVLLVHGWPLSHKIFEYQLVPMLNKGYRVVMLDLRGFGSSDAPAGGYSYDQMACDIHCVVKQLKLHDVTLVGFSMGGAIALRYMNRFEGCGVKKLILLAAAAPSWTRRPGYPYGLTREYVNSLIAQAATDRAKLACEFSHKQLFYCPHSQAVKGWFEDIALSASSIGTVQTAISLRDEDTRQDLAAVKVPTVILHGAKDVVVSSDLARLQHEGIADSRLITLPNSGHGIMYDELERFNRVFFASLPGWDE